MRKVLFILAILLLFLSPSKKEVDLSYEDLEAYGIAGAMGMIPSPTSLKPDPVEECKCNKSTGMISYDGGTSLTRCPCENGECGCKKSSGSVEAESRIPRIILVTQLRSCKYCRVFDKEVISILRNDAHKKAGWTIGKGKKDALQILDLDDPDSIKTIDDLGIEFDSIPAFYKVTHSGVEEGPVGAISYKSFIEFSNSKKK